jgi:hypothetical protein
MNRAHLYFVLSIIFIQSIFAQNFRPQIRLACGEAFKSATIDSLKDSTLIIRTDGLVRYVWIDSIAEIRVRKPGNLLRPISAGIFVGAALGYLAGQYIFSSTHEPGGPIYGGFGSGQPTVIGSTPSREGTDLRIILTVVGGGMGASIGYIASRRDTVIDLAGKTVDEKKRILMDLAPKAGSDPGH